MGEEDIELGYRLFRANAEFDATLNTTVYHQLHPMSKTILKEWLHNYTVFCEKYKTLEIYSRWKVFFKVMSPREYQELVARIAVGQLSREEEHSIKDQYAQFVEACDKWLSIGNSK